MLFFSIQNLKWTRRLALLGYISVIFLLVITLFFGYETKGARRWLKFGIQIQPSEFLKPLFIVCTAWLFEMQRQYKNFQGILISVGLLIFTCLLLLLQPDYGMTIVVAGVWFIQLFLAGVPLKKLVIPALGILVLLVVSYFALPHVQVRVQQMISGMFSGEPSYQIKKSLEAFGNGGLLGVGMGEGVVKLHIPDAHTDFIFPVAAEEYGLFLCLIIVLAYGTIVIRSMMLSMKESNMFITLSVCGLAISFGLQALINMASTLQLGPTKGMALPLISSGGSSLVGSAICIGMLLALTRKNIHAEDKDNDSIII
jgi:cell division protein FtsW